MQDEVLIAFKTFDTDSKRFFRGCIVPVEELGNRLQTFLDSRFVVRGTQRKMFT